MFSVFGEAVIGSVDVEELELSLMVFFLKSTQLGGGLSLSPNLLNVFFCVSNDVS